MKLTEFRLLTDENIDPTVVAFLRQQGVHRGVSMSDDQQPLPVGWEMAALGDVAANATEKVEPEDCPDAKYIGLEHIESKTNRILGHDSASSVRSTKGVFRSGDVLYGKLRPYLKKVCRPDFDGVCSTDILVYPSRNDLDNGYLLHFLTQATTAEYANENSNGINLPRVSATSLAEISFPLPPLAEQHRIVSKIEALQERSGRAAKALAEVGPLLEQFRQSILAAAFSGRLTADWREKRRTFVEDEHRRMDIPVRLLSSHDPSNHEEISDKNVQATNTKDETAAELLARIRTERRRRWEHAELAKHQAKGKQPPKDWKHKYEEPEPVDERELPELPEGWCWVRAEDVCEYITKGTTPPADKMTQDDGDVRFLKVGNLTFTGALDFTKENAYIDDATHNSGVYARSRIYPGDVLMNLVGPPLGKVSLIPPEIEHSNANQAIAIFRPITGLEARYLTMALTTPSILERIVSRAKQTSGQRNLTLELSRGLPLPLAPNEEQAEIVRIAKISLELVERLETLLASSKSCFTSLNQSILAKAFRGELVPQDPGDEPASELLARIREQRNNSGKNSQGTNSGKNAQGRKKGQRRMVIPARRSSHE